MGGVARGVFRDFRMGRVSLLPSSWHQLERMAFEKVAERLTPASTVPIPNACAGGKHTGGEEG